MRAEDRRTISCWRLAVARAHSAISPRVRPQPVQTLAPGSSLQIFWQGDGGRGSIRTLNHAAALAASAEPRRPTAARKITVFQARLEHGNR